MKKKSARAELLKATTKRPLGAAYSHARKVAAKNGGGKKKEREIANRYLRSKGHSAMGKSEGASTFGQYMQALASQPTGAGSASWAEYEQLFARNRANMASLQQEAQMRRDSRPW